MQKEVNYWNKYKDYGQHEHATQIRTLEQEVDDITTSFNEMQGRWQRILWNGARLNQRKQEKIISEPFFNFNA